MSRPVLVVMGVSGSGKSTFAKPLARRLHAPFQEGDDLHPAVNVAKMKAGVALDDEDRAPWLDAVAAWMHARIEDGGGGVVTCSALKRAYRDRLMATNPEARIVYLEGSRSLVGKRVAARKGHFMPPSLLDSQFATLEPPTADEDVIVVDISAPRHKQISGVLRDLRGGAKR